MSSRRQMPGSSRRHFLRTVGTTLGVGGFAGCLSKVGLTKVGHLQLKSVTLRWDYGGQTYQDQPLDLRFDRDERTVSGYHDPRFVGERVHAPDDVTVSEEVHHRLARRFDVKYGLGVCGSDFAGGEESYGCRNTRTGREDFNRVQLNDRAEVRLSDHRFDVLDVYEDEYAIESSDVRTLDFAELHAGNGIRSEEW